MIRVVLSSPMTYKKVVDISGEAIQDIFQAIIYSSAALWILL
jgi:hypothetical protein